MVQSRGRHNAQAQICRGNSRPARLAAVATTSRRQLVARNTSQLATVQPLPSLNERVDREPAGVNSASTTQIAATSACTSPALSCRPVLHALIILALLLILMGASLTLPFITMTQVQAPETIVRYDNIQRSSTDNDE